MEQRVKISRKVRNSLRWILKESVERGFRAAETEEGKYGSFSTDYQFVEVPFVIHTTDI